MTGPVRVFVPMTLADVRATIESGSLRPRSGVVFAVTADLRVEYDGADDEELEFLAMIDASRACLRMLDESTGPWIRVVAAADVPAITSASHRDRAAATVVGSIPMIDIASFHVDGAEAGDAVRAAAAVIDAADLGDLDAEFTVGSADDYALAWYAPSEMKYLLQELDSTD